jgi:hypothetical protein
VKISYLGLYYQTKVLGEGKLFGTVLSDQDTR